MKNVSTAILLISMIAISPLRATSAQIESGTPNVIFIKTDDQRQDSRNMTGHPVTKTSPIDRLAKERVFFESALITSPIFRPSRGNCFTGQCPGPHR
ncbi:hypothetical protein CA13_21880 [Planctomycetes bacterium CA13]|uniref:Uncharacterized protein n=1 Tax=Novipirellula herctigrandis TaxID=2527986 RepID=A0A5C5Z028_9BACT|nr:hypothetical protein CA13_21880 [Planctomycetes bacterium CA13]